MVSSATDARVLANCTLLPRPTCVHLTLSLTPYTSLLLILTRSFFFPQSTYDVELWNNKLRLRLEYGDRNLLAWAQAKRSFVEKLLAMAKAKGAEHEAVFKRSLPATTIMFS